MNSVPKLKTANDAEEVLRVLGLSVRASWCGLGEVWYDCCLNLTVTVWGDNGNMELATTKYNAAELLLVTINTAIAGLWPTLSEKKKALVTALCMKEE